jgi:hypothetical protein
MPVNVAHGMLNNFNSATTHTLSVGFQPKAGVFWFLPVDGTYNSSSSNTEFSVGFWARSGSSDVQRCHAAYRSASGASYFAFYTDCIAAVINTSSRSQYVYVSGVSATGLTLTVNTIINNTYNLRLHWILFGGDIQATCGHVSIPMGWTWNPITVSGAGFDVLFSSFVETQRSTPDAKYTFASCIAHEDRVAGTCRYTINHTGDGGGAQLHEVGSGTGAKVYMSSNSDYYMLVENVNNYNDLRLSRGPYGAFNASTFSYLSLKNIPAWSSMYNIYNATNSEEAKSFTLPKASSFFMAVASAWDSNSSYFRTIQGAFSTIMYSPQSGSRAFAVTKVGTTIYNYSSLDRTYVVHIQGTSWNDNINTWYWRHVSYSGGTWNYATRTRAGSLYVPVFILGLGDTAYELLVSSNSQRSLSRRVSRFRTYHVSSSSSVFLSAVTPFKQILSAASNGVAQIAKRLSRSLAGFSNQTATLRRRRFLSLVAKNSYITSLRILTRKLLHAVSDYWAFIRMPMNMSQTLIVMSNSLAVLLKRIPVLLGTLSDQEAKIEKAILLILRAFSSWLAWIELKILKTLEVLSDTTNEVGREVTYLFRTYEQELSALSTSVSKIARTFFRELLAEAYQWVRMERIRGPVFALRSWLWRIGRRKHGCNS